VTLAALIAIGAVVAFLVLHGIPHGLKGSSGGSKSGSGTPVHLAGVKAYDPYGDHSEHDADAPKATDTLSSTYWETQTYFDAPSLGKKGVGLVLDAGKTVQLHHLGFATSTPGFVAEILGGDSENGPFPDVVGDSKAVPGTGRVTYSIHGSPHRYYVIWITRLGPSYQKATVNAVSAN
jgi:hypothetical protein